MEDIEVNMEDLEELKRRNFEERLKFIELYVAYLKKHKVKIEEV